MHARFALIFERGAARHRARRRACELDLQILLDSGPMLAVADRATPAAVTGGDVLVGQLFDASGAQMLLADARDPRQPSGLSPGVWGNFVLAGASATGQSVYRDPSGSVPAYRLPGGAVVSDAGMSAALGLLDEAAVDPHFVVHWLQYPHLRTARTGLAGVRELLPGMMGRACGNGWSEELLWRPWDHVRRARAVEEGALARRLREVAVRTVAAQVPAVPVLLKLSGGLDSSIIAACLAQAGIPFAAVNFVSASADGDEADHARAVAAAAGSELILIREQDLPAGPGLAPQRTFRPGPNPVLVHLDEAIEAHRQEMNASLVDGAGGDNLFGHLTSASPVIDALLAEGPAQAWRTLRDIAERADCTYWQVAANAARRAIVRAPAWPRDTDFLRSEALLARPEAHPWLAAPWWAPPGKRDHVSSLAHIQHFLDRRANPEADRLHPLMAQPLLELCLSVPAWEWLRGGIDRAVARAAFADRLPPRVALRRDKGSLQGLFHRYFDRHAGSLREWLLDGELRRMGIVDVVGIEQALTAGRWADDAVQMRISEMAALESWVRSWKA